MSLFRIVCGLWLATCCLACDRPAGTSASRCVFRDSIVVRTTPVRNQARSGTCWAFGGIALLESELLRETGRAYDLSEMWIVRHAYFEKAVKYVRTRGGADFGEGGEIQDVLALVDRYGIVPQSVYEGNSSDGRYDHRQLVRAVKRCAERIVREEAYRTDGWQAQIAAELDRRMGSVPGSFSFDGATYTPQAFRDTLGLRAADFVALTSFTHHPFGEAFVLEIPDNWMAHRTGNLPLDELLALLDGALAAGYGVAWDADVSEEGFDRRRGVAMLPLNPASGALPVEEPMLLAEERQRQFDTQQTTDDHIMQLVGVAVDAFGKRYYKVKNSWGTQAGRRGGYWYVSRTYLGYKTIELVMSRRALEAAYRSRASADAEPSSAAEDEPEPELHAI